MAQFGFLQLHQRCVGTLYSSVSDTYDISPDVTDWWVNKLTSKVTAVQAVYGASPNYGDPYHELRYYSVATRDLNHIYAHADVMLPTRSTHTTSMTPMGTRPA